MKSPAEAPSAPVTEDDTHDIHGMPGHLIRRAQQIAVALFAEETAAFDLTPIQFALLSELNRSGSLDQVTIAAHIAVDVATLGQVATRLEERELLARRADRVDARRKRLAITRKGRALLKLATPGVLQAQSRIMAPLAPREQATFMCLLEKLVSCNNDRSRAPMRRAGGTR